MNQLCYQFLLVFPIACVCVYVVTEPEILRHSFSLDLFIFYSSWLQTSSCTFISIYHIPCMVYGSLNRFMLASFCVECVPDRDFFSTLISPSIDQPMSNQCEWSFQLIELNASIKSFGILLFDSIVIAIHKLIIAH